MMTDTRFFAAALVAALLTATTAPATEISMFGDGPKRNMVDLEAEGLPAEWDVDSGMNVKWSQPVGSQSYAGPVVHGGKVFVGTNNEGLRNPKLTKDRGVVMAFDEKTGEFLWQITHTKLPESKLHDWPLQGVCSTPAIEGDRIYYVSNRAQVVALDTEGFRDGENDGPYTDEADTSEIDGLKARLAEDEKDHQSRLDLANALNAAGQREEALDELLRLYELDRNWNDEAARKQLLTFFEAWGMTDELTVAGRKRLSSLMFA